MEFTKESYGKIINALEHHNEKESMDMTSQLLTTYENKYKYMDKHSLTISEEAQFRADTKMMFDVIHITFTNEDLISQVEDGLDSDDDDDEQKAKNDLEKTEYFKFVDNIKYVLAQIDTVNLADPEHEFVNICNNSIAYMNKKNQDMNKLTDTMKRMNNTLQSLEEVVGYLVSPIKEQLIRPAESTLSKQ